MWRPPCCEEMYAFTLRLGMSGEVISVRARIPFVWPSCVLLWEEFAPPCSRWRRYAPRLRPRSTSRDQANQTDRASFPPAVSWFTWKESFGFVSRLPSHLIREIRHLVTYKQLQYKAGLPKCSQLEIHKRIMFVCVCVCWRKREKEKSSLIQVENVVSVCLKGNSELKNV